MLKLELVEDIGDQTVHNATLHYMWYKGQQCRFTQRLVHDLRLRALQTAGQVDTYSSFFFIAIYSFNSEKRDMALHQHMQHRVP